MTCSQGGLMQPLRCRWGWLRGSGVGRFVRKGCWTRRRCFRRWQRRNSHARFWMTPAALDYQGCAEASLCKLLAKLYKKLGQPDEARIWDAELTKYVARQNDPPTHLQKVVGRVPRPRSDLSKYPRIGNISPCIRHARPPPRSSGLSSPERMFNADPNNSFLWPGLACLDCGRAWWWNRYRNKHSCDHCTSKKFVKIPIRSVWICTYLKLTSAPSKGSDAQVAMLSGQILSFGWPRPCTTLV